MDGDGRASSIRRNTDTFAVEISWGNCWCLPGKMPVLPEKALLEGVHQAGDGAVQLFVGAAHFFDLMDGVQHGGVVFTTELAADFGERSGGELLDDVHGHLPRESDGASVAADFEILLAQIEVLADALLDEVDGDAFFL